MNIKHILLSLSLSLAFINPVFAGRSCGESSLLKEDVVIKATTASQKMIDAANLLSPDGSKVFLIGRRGQDLDEYKIKYSHGAYLMKNNNTWEVFHELNECSSDKSNLYNEGILNFFLDDLYKYDSIIISFDDKTNHSLKQILSDKDTLQQAHNPHYNLVSYPFSSKYQNSNGWLLEIMAQALANNENKQLHNHEEFIRYIQNIGYQPDTLNIGMFKRLGGRMFKANVAFDDQPFDQRMAGHIETYTFDGLFTFFKQQNIVSQSMEISY